MSEHSAARPHGYVAFGDRSGRLRESDTLQCCHCGRHWVVQPGSGRKRGFCLRCGQVTCGGAECAECVPQELRLENVEQGRAAGHRPIAAPVGCHISPGGLVLPGSGSS
jgi:hypothetical protein